MVSLLICFRFVFEVDFCGLFSALVIWVLCVCFGLLIALVLVRLN